MDQSSIPLTGQPSEAGLFELMLSCDATVFADTELEELQGVEFSHWIRVGESDGLEDVMSSDHSIMLYPNPTKSREMYLGGVPGDQTWDAALHSLSGKVVRSYSGRGEARIDMFNLPVGMYVLQYTPAMGPVQVQRVVIQ